MFVDQPELLLKFCHKVGAKKLAHKTKGLYVELLLQRIYLVGRGRYRRVKSRLRRCPVVRRRFGVRCIGLVCDGMRLQAR